MADILRNRPLLIFAVGLVVGLTVREYPWNGVLLLPLAILIRDFQRWIGLLLGFLLGCWLSPTVPKIGIEDKEYVRSPARICSVPRLYPNRIAYEVELRGKKLSVFEPATADRSLGDRLNLIGLAKPLREGSEDYMLAKGIVGRFDPMSVESVSQGPAWYRAAAGVRKAFVGFTHRAMSPERAAILDALCFNVEGGLTDSFEDDLKATGTIHIISASGLHVFILAGVLDWLLGLLPIPRAWRLLLLGVLLTFYAAAAGLQPAIIRSVLMSMVALTAYLWRRESDLLTTLALAAVAYLVFDPLGIYSIGFQFSFLTVAAFALFGRIKEAFPRTAWGILKEQAVEAFQTTHAAFWATLPLLVFYFGAISIVAIPTNLVIIPVVMSLVVLGLAAFAISSWIPAISQGVSDYLLSPMVAYLEGMIGLFANLTKLDLPTAAFSGYWLIPVYVVMCWTVRERVRPA
jgi:competence protein ComEC